jgi:hypothetical protein
VPAELRARDAGRAATGVRIALELTWLGEVSDELAHQPERLLRRMAAPWSDTIACQ